MSWKKGLNEGELDHLKSHGASDLNTFKQVRYLQKNRANQYNLKEVCYTCRNIELKIFKNEQLQLL